MQPRLPRLRINWHALSALLFLLSLAPCGWAQSTAYRASEPFAIPKFYLPAEAGSVIHSPVEDAGELDPMGLPELPIPHLLLDVDISPAVLHFPRDPQSQFALPPQQSQQAADSSAPAIDAGTTFAQENAEFGTMSVNGIAINDAWAAFQDVMPRAPSLYARETPIVDPSAPGYSIDSGPYHWRGLLAQSLMFNVFENTFRAFSDDQIRRMLANKPFWHDYVASIKQFNMRRWNDGDDFLVNYVGHPMQGAVSGFIEIQNDPRGRQLEIGANPEYWKSRFHAFLWAEIYSTHSEIGFLGEAGIGNEGGWTYPIKCKTPGCPNWNPRTMHSTNNTGWVDFTITPFVGTLWLLAEDALDRYVSDRLQGGDRFNLGYAFLRAGLNPSRSMANAMRFKAPWYRDFQHDPELENSLMVHSQPSDEEIAEAGRFRRFAVAPFFHAMPIGSPAQPCTLCFGGPGLGIDVDVAITHWLSASFSVSSQSGILQKGTTAIGSTRSIGYGLRFVHEGRGDTLSLAVRPGIVTDEIVMPLKLDVEHNTFVHPVVNVDHTAVTLLLTNDYKLSKTVALRSSIGDTIVRYKSPILEPPGIGKPPYLSWLSKDDYTNKSNWICETGPVVRF